MKVIGIIPEKLSSIRFPNKPLAKINGITLAQRVYDCVSKSKYLDEIFIASPDKKILNIAKDFGAKTLQSSPSNRQCIECVSEVCEHLDFDYLCLVQGDEPLINYKTIDTLISKAKDGICINSVGYIKNKSELENRNIIKVLYTTEDRILYLTRYPVTTNCKQLGLMLFPSSIIKEYKWIPQMSYEISESVDMNRLIQTNYDIRLSYSPYDTYSVDVPGDIQIIEKMLNKVGK